MCCGSILSPLGIAFDPWNSQLVDQVAIFFLAGHETSESALAWSLYLLAENQDVQTRLADEVRTHDLDIAGLSKMPLLRGVDGAQNHMPRGVLRSHIAKRITSGAKPMAFTSA